MISQLVFSCRWKWHTSSALAAIAVRVWTPNITNDVYCLIVSLQLMWATEDLPNTFRPLALVHRFAFLVDMHRSYLGVRFWERSRTWQQWRRRAESHVLPSIRMRLGEAMRRDGIMRFATNIAGRQCGNRYRPNVRLDSGTMRESVIGCRIIVVGSTKCQSGTPRAQMVLLPLGHGLRLINHDFVSKKVDRI